MIPAGVTPAGGSSATRQCAPICLLPRHAAPLQRRSARTFLALREEAQGRDARDAASYVEFGSYLVDNCLTKVDRMSMASLAGSTRATLTEKSSSTRSASLRA